MLEIAEAIDRRLRQHTPRDRGAQLEGSRPGWLHWLGRQMVPNVGTLLMVVVLLLTIPSLAAPLVAPSATSTSTISYQGCLADSSGNPLTDKVNMEFRIYDVPTGRAPLWTEMWTGGNAVDVSDGLFNVMLGSIDNTLALAIEGYDELYLGITVGTDSEMVPRVQLGSVPFSMQPQQALTVPDGSITAAKLGDGAVTTDKLDIDDGLDMTGDLAVNGIDLDPIFLETIEGDYLIHVTPYGDASLYVEEIGPGYLVRGREGDSDVSFTWRMSAHRKGYGGVRMEVVSEAPAVD